VLLILPEVLTSIAQLVKSSTQGGNDAFGFISAGAGDKIFEPFLGLYIALIFIVVVCSLGNRPQGSKWTYWFCVIVFGICNVLTLYCAGE
jgi:chitin synthase